MSRYYTSQCSVVVDLTKALHEVGLEWLTLELQHQDGPNWSLKGTVGYQPTTETNMKADVGP